MRCALVLNDDFSAWHFRKNLIRTLCERGIDVCVITPDGPYVSYIQSLGARHIPVKMTRFLSPIGDLRLLMGLYRIFSSGEYDLVHNMTIKPNIYGAVAARLAGVPKIVGLVSGLGYAFSGDMYWRDRVLRTVVSWMYWVAGKLSNRFWFQNEEDFRFFVEARLLDPTKAVLIRGSGINLQEYSPEAVERGDVERLRTELGMAESTQLVLMMVARVVWSKGVREFIEASQRVGRSGRDVHFLLVGPQDPASPDPVPKEFLHQVVSPRLTWLGFRRDVKEILALADIVVLPSYYREGVPRVLLEAMALGKPIVTTDNVGCREVVESGKNGFIVPPKDPEALASAIDLLLDSSALRASFGGYGRAKAKQEFDESLVIRRVLTELYGLSG